MDITSVSSINTLTRQSYAPAPAARVAATDYSLPSVDAVKSIGQPIQKASAVDIQKAVDASNKVLQSKTSNELHFAIEKGTGLAVVKLISRQSGETILQFPSEAMLQIAKGIDQVTGALLQQKA